jgi:hypothetical protein
MGAWQIAAESLVAEIFVGPGALPVALDMEALQRRRLGIRLRWRVDICGLGVQPAHASVHAGFFADDSGASCSTT